MHENQLILYLQWVHQEMKQNALEAAQEKKTLEDGLADASKPIHPSEGALRD